MRDPERHVFATMIHAAETEGGWPGGRGTGTWYEVVWTVASTVAAGSLARSLRVRCCDSRAGYRLSAGPGCMKCAQVEPRLAPSLTSGETRQVCAPSFMQERMLPV